MSKITLNDIGRLDFNLATTFMALWQERSVSRAANRLALSQSAVSASLARLRKLTGDPLFVRTRSGMEPTARAIAAAGPIQQAVELLRDALIVDPGFDPASSRRHFSIGMSDDFEVAIGPAISTELLRTAPGVSIVIRQTNRHAVEQMLENREIDLAVASGVPARGWLDARDIGESGYATILNNDLCQAALPLSLEDYLALPHILVSFSGREGIVDAGLKRIGARRTVHTALTHFSTLPSYLATMRAVATLPSHAARALTARSGLSLSPAPISLGTYRVAVLCRRDVSEDPGVRWMSSIIGEKFQAFGAAEGHLDFG